MRWFKDIHELQDLFTKCIFNPNDRASQAQQTLTYYKLMMITTVLPHF